MDNYTSKENMEGSLLVILFVMQLHWVFKQKDWCIICLQLKYANESQFEKWWISEKSKFPSKPQYKPTKENC